MTETAIVKSIDGDTVKMGCGLSEGCSSCSSSFCSAEKRMFEAVNPKGLQIERGDLVDIYIPPGKAVAAGFLVLIVPLLLFVAAYLVAGRVVSGASEGVQALFGLIGLAAGFLLSFAYSRKKKAAGMPVIVSIRTKAAEVNDPQTSL
ncbi:MAG: SoxR reducing system RseC family protein [Spirochaetales bacterium]|nr:SoxR reducing system RseC family protein [Spirochaetales bacterium]